MYVGKMNSVAKTRMFTFFEDVKAVFVGIEIIVIPFILL